MTNETKLKLMKVCMQEIDNLTVAKEKINEKISKSELGVKRKNINLQIKNLQVAMHDMIEGVGYYDPNQMTIEDYIDHRAAIDISERKNNIEKQEKNESEFVNDSQKIDEAFDEIENQDDNFFNTELEKNA